MPPQELVLAVDLGGTKVDAALVDATAALVPGSRHRHPTGHASDHASLEAAVRDVVEQAMASVPDGATVAGAGIGSAGPVSREDGLIYPLNMPGVNGFPLRDIVASASGLADVRLQLDGLCIALAEHWVGALQNFHTALGMVVSTGIGGGLLIDGRLISGRSGNAGHVGQVRVRTRLGAGADAASTFEGVASGTAIVAWARAQGWTGETGQNLGASYAAGDKIAIAAVQRCGETIGDAVGTIAAVVDLEAVAIGGGFARITPDLFDIARATLREHAPLERLRDVQILPTGLSDEGPLIGAAGVILRQDLVPSSHAR